MKLVVQRVSSASVTVDGAVTGQIGNGYLVLFGAGKGDNKAMCDKLADKLSKLRIFSDENDKINLSIADVNGDMLVVSQFTLYADCSHGNRPSFVNACPPDEANELYEYFCSVIEQKTGKKTQRGIFGADMKVSLTNDGPFTVILEA